MGRKRAVKGGADAESDSQLSETSVGSSDNHQSVMDEKSYQETCDDLPHKRSKTDNDGFLQPASPNIPIGSVHHLKGLISAEIKQAPIATHTDSRGAAGDGPDIMQSMLEDGGKSSSLETLLKELGQESKMMHLTMSKPFSESESFETFSLTRLDAILQEARQLEENLIQQKEKLRNRLQLLSKTLQL